MGKQLKSADILGELAKEEQAPPAPAATAPKRPKPDMDIAQLKAQAEAAAAGKPSAFQSDLRARLREKKNFHLGELPAFIVDAFEAEAVKMNKSKRHFLYHLLRTHGVDIPPDDQLDGRKL